MSPDQIAWARAVAEESYDGQLIRDLCNALGKAWDEGHESGFWNGRESAGSGEMALVGVEHAAANNPYRDAA